MDDRDRPLRERRASRKGSATRREGNLHREDPRECARRDLERRRRREPEGGFWHSVALVGSVGWPIVTLSVGSAVLGHHFDQRFGTGARLTLVLLFIGAGVGTWMAYRAMEGRP